MIVDNALNSLRVKLMDCGDACLGKGRTQKFRQLEFTQLMYRS